MTNQSRDAMLEAFKTKRLHKMKNQLAVAALLNGIASKIEQLEIEEGARVLDSSDYIALLQHRIELAGLALSVLVPYRSHGIALIRSTIEELEQFGHELAAGDEDELPLLEAIADAQTLGDALLQIHA